MEKIEYNGTTKVEDVLALEFIDVFISYFTDNLIFWEIIDEIDINKKYEENRWIETREIKDIVLRVLDTKEGYSFQDFEKDYREIYSAIFDEVTFRLEEGFLVFAEGTIHGLDDAHFMDMPDTLICRGVIDVISFISDCGFQFSGKYYDGFSSIFIPEEELE